MVDFGFYYAIGWITGLSAIIYTVLKINEMRGIRRRKRWVWCIAMGLNETARIGFK